MGINVCADRQHLTCLDVELANTVGTEDLKAALLRILLYGLNHIGSNFPLCTRALGYTSALGQNSNNLSRNLH